MTTASFLSGNAVLRDVRIEPSGPLGGYIDVPPSKNATTRFILAAALADGRSEVLHPAHNDDAFALIRCCRALGARIDETDEGLIIAGVAGRPQNPGVLNPDNAGAVLRLLLAVGCLVDGPIRFESGFTESLGRRPNRELLDALKSLGARVLESGPDGELPIVIEAGRDKLRADSVSVDGRRSSQFLSALLYLGACLERPLHVSVMPQATGPALVSRPLIEQTLDALRRFGASIHESDEALGWKTEGGGLRGGRHAVPGDWPSAAALMAAVAVAGGMVTLRGLQDDTQGERRARTALEAMGCGFSSPEPGALVVHSKGDLRAIEFDGDLATDAVLALEAAACLAAGTSRFTGIGNLRIKESDRIRLPLEELAKLGVVSRHGADWVEIDGRPGGFEGGVEVDCHGDHRIAQMLAIVGTRCERGLTLRGADCVSKSYPGFFEDLARMGVHGGPA
jgi:3-phosphoshikimate 1-carboxyvinyltransferase